MNNKIGLLQVNNKIGLLHVNNKIELLHVNNKIGLEAGRSSTVPIIDIQFIVISPLKPKGFTTMHAWNQKGGMTQLLLKSTELKFTFPNIHACFKTVKS